MLLKHIKPEIKKILWKSQNGFLRNQSTTSQILTIYQIIKGVCTKILEVTLLFVDYYKAFDSTYRGKMERILQAYGLSKENVIAIILIHRNTKAKVHSPNGNPDFFNFVAGVLLGDTFAPYLFII